MVGKSSPRKRPPRAMVIDPGFSATGWAVIEVPPSGIYQVISAGVIKTRKSKARKRLRVSDENIDRARQIYRELWKIPNLSSPKISAIFVEAFAGARDFNQANGYGIMKGILASLHEEYNEIPFEYYTPREIRKAVLGKVSGTKKEIEKVIEVEFIFNTDLPSSKEDRVHVIDALSVFLAAKYGTVYRTVFKR